MTTTPRHRFGVPKALPSMTTASTAETFKSSSDTMYVLYAETMVSVISARGVLYMKRSQKVVAIPNARPAKGPPTASCTNSLWKMMRQSGACIYYSLGSHQQKTEV